MSGKMVSARYASGLDFGLCRTPMVHEGRTFWITQLL